MAGHAAHAVVQQDVGGAGRARAAVGADDAVGGERHLHLLGFEPLVQKLGGALGEDLDQRDDVVRAQAAQASGELQVVDEIAQAAGREMRRGREQQVLYDLGEALELVFVGGIDFGVAGRELGDLRQGLGAVLPHEEVAAVGKGRKEGGVLGVHVVAEAFEFELANDALLQQAGEIGRGGDAVAGPDLFGDGAAAHQFAALEHQHLAAGAREVSGGDQAVVAAADDDGVVLGHFRNVSASGRPPPPAAAA